MNIRIIVVYLVFNNEVVIFIVNVYDIYFVFYVKVLLNKLFLIIKFKCYFLGMKVV